MSDFPILSRKIHGKRLVYLDTAATSQKPQAVIDAISSYYAESNANIHRGIYQLSEESTKLYDEARTAVADFVGALPSNIIFTSGATESLNLVAHAWRDKLQPGDEILLTPQEHHANIVPWHAIAEKTGARVVFCDLDDNLEITPDNVLAKVNENTKVAAITHASNVIGSVTPLREIIPRLQEKGVFVVVDGAQAVPHFPVDLGKLGADAYFFSGHKMLGPQGIGVLYLKDLSLEPYKKGGDMIVDVTEECAEYVNGEPQRFEAGTPHIAGAVGLHAAVRYLENHGMQNVHDHSLKLAQKAWAGLAAIDGVTLYGQRPVHTHAAVVSFNIAGIHPHDVAQLLDEDGVCIRSGRHCAHPFLERIGAVATNRASFYLYNTEEDVDALITGVHKAVKVFA